MTLQRRGSVYGSNVPMITELGEWAHHAFKFVVPYARLFSVLLSFGS